MCTFCKEKDYIEHFLFSCQEVKKIWCHVENILSAQTGMRISLNVCNVLFGISGKFTKKVEKCINFHILVGKMCISKYKYGNKYDMIAMFDNEMQMRG